MGDARCPRSTKGPGARMVLGLLLVLPLMLGARGCERPGGEAECAGTCAGRGGEALVAGRGAAGGDAASGHTAGESGNRGGCIYAGRRHDVGDSFPSDDGCNTCSCGADGRVACTLRACAGGRGGRSGGSDQAGGGGSSGGTGDAGRDGNGGNGKVCGGIAGLACRDGEYCAYTEDAQCGAADQTGTCTPIPQACTREYAPVCGCDDQTYSNACVAASKGIAVARRGECGGGGSGQTCGGIASLECSGRDEFCNYEPSAGGQGCDGSVSDAAGVCQARPQACTLQYDPVCGCDRRTYGNACEAHAAGQSALHDGMCTEIDCAAIGGHPVDGLGPAPVCPRGETSYGPIMYSNGMIAIEGTICCVP